MEKRLILAIVLSFLVLFGYQALFNKANKPAAKPPVPAEAAPVPAVPGTVGRAPVETKPAVSENKPAPAPAQGAVAAPGETDVVVETSLYRAVWSNKGGVLKSWVLKKHLNSARQPLELIPAAAAEIGRYPFSLGLDDAELTRVLNGSLFEASATSIDLADGAGGELRFVFSDGTSVQAEKTIRFTGEHASGDFIGLGRLPPGTQGPLLDRRRAGQ